MVKNLLTIVMYHYVRPLRLTRFPQLKALDLEDFREQLSYLRRHYSLISGEQLIAALRKRGGRGWELPQNAALLTFDDGYADHYRYVFPILDEAGVPACFFPVAGAIVERSLIAVNRIHFILASVEDKRVIVKDILDALERNRKQHGLKSGPEYYQELATPFLWDTSEVMFIKRMLQVALPPVLQDEVSRSLFAKYVSVDEQAFAEELYLTPDQLRCMARSGMHLGSHGYSHRRLSGLAVEEQAAEVDRSLAMLESVGAGTRAWIMCYPWGESDDSLRSVLRARGCVAGLTIVAALASAEGDPLQMPRLDTNDLPRQNSAPPNEWTRKVLTM